MIQSHVLIVDDIPDNISYVMSILDEESYELSYATTGLMALKMLESAPTDFDLILLDIMMPIMDGFELCALIKQNPDLCNIPVIFLTAHADMNAIQRCFDLGAVDYISKPYQSCELLSRVKTHLKLYHSHNTLHTTNKRLDYKIRHQYNRLMSELEDTQQQIIWILTGVMESISDETSKHTQRVAKLAALLASAHPALSDRDEKILYHTAPMHDIGKMLVPVELLHKRGIYNSVERKQMETHTTKAFRLLCASNKEYIKSAATIAHQHHENWDGSGYPNNLVGNDIHIYSRIVALVDVFDALTHKRCYKNAWTVAEAVAFIQQNKGIKFDPELVELFLDNMEAILKILEI